MSAAHYRRADTPQQDRVWEELTIRGLIATPQQYVEYTDRDTNERVGVRFSVTFDRGRGSGTNFASDSAGNILPFDLSCHCESWKDNHADAIEGLAAGRYTAELIAWESRERLCDCGSGLASLRYHDAQGIYLRRACPQCWPKVSRRYRPEILTGYNEADVDEPIDPEP